jgi:hypothetical protein
MLWRETPRRRATSTTFQPSCTTASTAWYRSSMTLSSTSTAHLPASTKGRDKETGQAGTVKHQPEPPSTISRIRCQGSAGAMSSLR